MRSLGSYQQIPQQQQQLQGQHYNYNRRHHYHYGVRLQAISLHYQRRTPGLAQGQACKPTSHSTTNAGHPDEHKDQVATYNLVTTPSFGGEPVGLLQRYFKYGGFLPSSTTVTSSSTTEVVQSRQASDDYVDHTGDRRCNYQHCC